MKIAIATPLYPPDLGGPAKYAAGIEEECKRRGIVADVIAYGAAERTLPIGLRHLWYFFRLLPAAQGADFILALDTWSVGLPAVFASKVSGKPLSVRIGGDYLWERYCERHAPLKLSEFYDKTRFTGLDRFIFSATKFFLDHADRLLFTTRWQAEIWKEAYQIPEGKITLLENYFPSERAFGDAKNHAFVFAGRDIAIKNSTRVHDAFAHARARFPDITLDTRVLAPAEHARRMKECYAVLIGSISEVNPNQAVDAITAGKPFIAPRDSGAYERLHEVGTFVDTMDVAALAHAIETLADPSGYANAEARVRAFTFSHPWSAIVDEILAAVKSL